MTDPQNPASHHESAADPSLSDAEIEIAPASGHGARRAVLRGLGVVLPPLLTIVVLIWAWSAIENRVLIPVEGGIRYLMVLGFADIRHSVPKDAVLDTSEDVTGAKKRPGFTYQSVTYVPGPTGRHYLPAYVVREVDDHADAFGASSLPPKTAAAYWDRYYQLHYMPRWIVVPVFLILFISLLYFLGRAFTGGIGRWFVSTFDATILRIPIVNKVYGSVKQITDFAFDDRQIEFNRVVAIQYPREGIWSLGFVTGNGMREISEAAGEPMLSVLMPTSPMPMTGFTVTVRRSEAIDLELTIDEAIQFVVSCGVVVPPQQRVESTLKELPSKPASGLSTTART
ncbi:DUF502 domain-containing protein [Allorhodopirellula heiligendammensis]|uniref:DUF502 domain-containing protein n=1 Tax=Allorhodopirellula heiligendammensis TaxID=2714739 RepID=A0A5C6C4P9_9BACT|nr:DUF502 domain-containing protein [Allorhodopirellula heiligendammensis]TWU18967.1 hypothetical protein Poly21_11380 [Allorhodopirellula heiligendammensis]